MAKAKPVKVVSSSGGSIDFTLFMAFLGALVYFVQNSEGFWGFIVAVFKAIVWPAFLVHSGFESLGI